MKIEPGFGNGDDEPRVGRRLRQRCDEHRHWLSGRRRNRRWRRLVGPSGRDACGLPFDHAVTVPREGAQHVATGPTPRARHTPRRL